MSVRLAKLISVARGESPADVVLANARVVNVFTGDVEWGDVAIYGDKVAGVGAYPLGRERIDVKGGYVAPGLINGHTHLESSMLDVGQYARAVVPRGTLAVVTDLHEIANVAGMTGIKYVRDCARRLPLSLFLMAPSCVPATSLETSGATIGADEIGQMLRWQGGIGLGEVMNFPGVIGGDETVLGKIERAKGRVLDGHAPGVSGRELSAYIAAGIHSDHESVSLSEAEEKLRRGMYVMIREGSSEKNLDTLLPLVTDKTYKRCFFVVDDRSAVDLLHDGDIDAVVRKAISRGLDPVRAIQMATLNIAEYFRLEGLGAVAAGYQANLIVIDDLSRLNVNLVFYQGRIVARDRQALFSEHHGKREGLERTVHIKPFGVEALKMPVTAETEPVIEIVPGQIITRKRREKIKVVDGCIVPDVDRDILKLVVVERHKATGNIGLGLVTGFNLKRGALASSVAHDSHNIVAVGTSDADIFVAVKHIEKMQGGLVVVAEGEVITSLPLPVAGLLSGEPLETVVANIEEVEQVARELGTRLTSPFSTLSFVALPVIPELRLTDLGLVDVSEFRIIKKGITV